MCVRKSSKYDNFTVLYFILGPTKTMRHLIIMTWHRVQSVKQFYCVLGLISEKYCDKVCGQGTKCGLHNLRPVPEETRDHGHVLTCQDDSPVEVVTLDSDLVTIQTPDTSEVVVIDNVESGDPSCDPGALLSAVTYWCQGKVGGCELDRRHVTSLLSDTCHDVSRVTIHWHPEPEYTSTEIPCPTHARGPFTKKFSKT